MLAFVSPSMESPWRYDLRLSNAATRRDLSIVEAKALAVEHEWSLVGMPELNAQFPSPGA